MSEQQENNPKQGMSKEEIALELMRFVASTTGLGKAAGGAGFGGKPPKTPEEQVDVLLQLYERCRNLVEKPR
jgi:hypothetical protein